MSLSIKLDVQWVPRNQNTIADTLGKIYDFKDWETTNTLFKYLNRVQRPFAIDRFTDNKNIIAYWFHTFQKQICIKFDFS